MNSPERQAEIGRLRGEIARLEGLKGRLDILLTEVASEELAAQGISIGSVVTASHGYGTDQRRRYRVMRIAAKGPREERPRILARHIKADGTEGKSKWLYSYT